MKKLLRKALENVSSKILVVDENLNLIFASNEAEAFLLFNSKNSEGHGIESIFSERPSNIFEIKRLLAEKDSLEKSRRKIYLKGGLEKICTYEISFFEIESKKYLFYEFYDANQSRELNRMKRQTISTVTATFSKGLAHEIRNPLSGIKGATQLLEPKLKNEELKDYTKIILKETERLSDLVTKILDRQFEIQKSPVNIHSILETLPHYLGTISKDKIQITKDSKFNEISQKMSNIGAKLIIEAINLIKNNNLKVGISIKPKTEAKEIIPYLELIDLILVMTVEPGFGGQKFLSNQLKKIKDIKDLISNRNIELEVDGGINYDTSKKVIEAGANVLVSGSTIFNQNNGNLKKNPKNIRTRCCAHIQYGNLSVLIDTSPDLRQQLLRHRIKKIDKVFYSHTHSDQTHGINDLRIFYIINNSKHNS